MKKRLILLIILGLSITLIAQERSLESFISEAQALKAEGKFKKAVDVLKIAIENYPDASNAHLQLGLTLGEQGGKASKTGNIFLAMKSTNGCFDEMEKVVQLDPQNYDAHFYYGVYAMNVPNFFNKLDIGVEHLEKALELLKVQPGGPAPQAAVAVYQYLGEGYQRQGKIAEAKSAWNKVLALAPQGEMAEAAKSGLKKMEGMKVQPKEEKVAEKKESENIQSIKKQLEDSPDNFDLVMALGQAYMEEDNWTEARVVFKRATQLDPNSKEAQFMLVRAIGKDVEKGYDERIYETQDTRTHLAFAVVQEMERALELDPDNVEMKLQYATMCVYMPFFVGKIDKGLTILEEMAKDESLPESVKSQVLYTLGFSYRRKGNAYWMKLAKLHPNADEVQSVYEEYGLREHGKEKAKTKGEKVVVTFHLGLMDELSPQTAVWVEDMKGYHVKTLYISGFSGFAKEKQVVLPHFAKQTSFETDGTTGASIDWGKHTYIWDLTNHKGKRVKKGMYKIKVEVSWWPSMRYGLAEAEIQVGKKPTEITVTKAPFIPMLQVVYQK